MRILAGDFNASLDHAAMRRLLDRGYKDAAAQVGAGLIPTWPANKRIPPIITIDHVLVDHRVGVKAVSVHDVPGTDHRAVFAELSRAVSRARVLSQPSRPGSRRSTSSGVRRRCQPGRGRHHARAGSLRAQRRHQVGVVQVRVRPSRAAGRPQASATAPPRFGRADRDLRPAQLAEELADQQRRQVGRVGGDHRGLVAAEPAE